MVARRLKNPQTILQPNDVTASHSCLFNLSILPNLSKATASPGLANLAVAHYGKTGTQKT